MAYLIYFQNFMINKINKLNNSLPQLKFRRFEFKYRIPRFLVDKITTDLLNYMEWDSFVINKPEKFYQVSSLYFDSEGFGCYREKMAGVKDRKKLRLRIYSTILNPDMKIFVEIKRKRDMAILKDRLIINYQDYLNILSKKPSVFLNNQLSTQEQDVWKEFLWIKRYNCMTPKVMVVYKRKPLMGRVNNKFRITFDSDIQACPANQLDFFSRRRNVLFDDVIMELKYNNTIPDWFHFIIQKYQLNRVAFSKYCKSLEVCHKYYKYV